MTFRLFFLATRRLQCWRIHRNSSGRARSRIPIPGVDFITRIPILLRYALIARTSFGPPCKTRSSCTTFLANLTPSHPQPTAPQPPSPCPQNSVSCQSCTPHQRPFPALTALPLPNPDTHLEPTRISVWILTMPFSCSMQWHCPITFITASQLPSTHHPRRKTSARIPDSSNYHLSNSSTLPVHKYFIPVA